MINSRWFVYKEIARAHARNEKFGGNATTSFENLSTFGQTTFCQRMPPANPFSKWSTSVPLICALFFHFVVVLDNTDDDHLFWARLSFVCSLSASLLLLVVCFVVVARSAVHFNFLFFLRQFYQENRRDLLSAIKNSQFRKRSTTHSFLSLRLASFFLSSVLWDAFTTNGNLCFR